MKALLTSKLSIGIALLLGILTITGTASAALFTDVNLGTAGSSGLNLGVFVTGATTVSGTGYSTFNTNLGLSSGSNTNLSGMGTLSGTIYKDPSASVQNNLATSFNVTGGVTAQSLSAALTSAQSAASNALSLSANQTFGTGISSSTTITDSGGTLNALGGYNKVVNITGNISLNGSSTALTISGGANDYFIVNVSGLVSVSGGADILTTGGIANSHILYNIQGTGSSLTLNGTGSVIDGTFLAVNSGQTMSLSSGTVNGGVMGYQIQTGSSCATTINGQLYQGPTSAVPLPPTLLMLAPGLFGLAVLRKRFTFKN